MQREVEALLAAYLADRNKETRVVQELLTILAVEGGAGPARPTNPFQPEMKTCRPRRSTASCPLQSANSELLVLRC